MATTRRRPIAAFSRVSPLGPPATIEGVFRGLLVPLVFAGVTLVPTAGSGAPAAPAPAATPSGPAVLVDRIAAVVGDEIVLESEVQKLVAVRFLEHKSGETRRRVSRPRPRGAHRRPPARASAPQDEWIRAEARGGRGPRRRARGTSRERTRHSGRRGARGRRNDPRGAGGMGHDAGSRSTAS